MRVQITMKSPDACLDAFEGLTDEQRSKVQTVADKFFEYGEYVTLEIDTETESCTVLKNSDN